MTQGMWRDGLRSLVAGVVCCAIGVVLIARVWHGIRLTAWLELSRPTEGVLSGAIVLAAVLGSILLLRRVGKLAVLAGLGGFTLAAVVGAVRALAGQGEWGRSFVFHSIEPAYWIVGMSALAAIPFAAWEYRRSEGFVDTYRPRASLLIALSLQIGVFLGSRLLPLASSWVATRPFAYKVGVTLGAQLLPALIYGSVVVTGLCRVTRTFKRESLKKAGGTLGWYHIGACALLIMTVLTATA